MKEERTMAVTEIPCPAPSCHFTAHCRPTETSAHQDMLNNHLIWPMPKAPLLKKAELRQSLVICLSSTFFQFNDSF